MTLGGVGAALMVASQTSAPEVATNFHSWMHWFSLKGSSVEFWGAPLSNITLTIGLISIIAPIFWLSWPSARAISRSWRSGKIQWLTPLEARAAYLGPEFKRELNATLAKYSALVGEGARLKYSLADDPDTNLQHYCDVREDQQRLVGGRLTELNESSVKTLKAALRDGTLVAKGVEIIDGRAEDERPIPSPYWHFLSLHFGQHSAEGQGRKYVGLLITQSANRSKLPKRS